MFQLRWFWKYMGSLRKYLVAGLCLSAATSVMVVFLPMLSQRLIDEVIVPQDTTLLLPILLAMLAIKVVQQSLRYLMVVLLEKNSQQMNVDLRRHLYGVIQNQDYKFAGKMPTGDLMTNMTSDLDMLRHTASWVSFVTMDSIVTFTAAFIYLMGVNWRLTLSMMVVMPFILVITRMFSRRVRPVYMQMREKVMDMSTAAQENIDGNRVVKAFAREEYEKDKFEDKNAQFRDVSLKAAYGAARYQPLLDLLGQALTVIIMALGGTFMIAGQLTAGQMLAFTSLTWALANPLRNLGVIINDTQRFFAAANRIISVFYSRPSIVDRSGATGFIQAGPLAVEYREVYFCAGGKEVLRDISFKLEPGQTLGILGTTGSGKTSLINMLGRFYEPEKGQVLINGRSLTHYTLDALRGAVGYAMQDVFLFSNSVDANIAYCDPDMPFEQVERSAKAADADGFIRRMSEGYDTLVGERGVGLSGGQRQRISLARALAKRPGLLVLDDTTSAVDMETELFIQEQLEELDFKCSKIIIAQRVASLQRADLILVMDKGEIVERGSHRELLARQGYYHHIWSLQNGGVESYGA